MSDIWRFRIVVALLLVFATVSGAQWSVIHSMSAAVEEAHRTSMSGQLLLERCIDDIRPGRNI